MTDRVAELDSRAPQLFQSAARHEAKRRRDGRLSEGFASHPEEGRGDCVSGVTVMWKGLHTLHSGYLASSLPRHESHHRENAVRAYSIAAWNPGFFRSGNVRSSGDFHEIVVRNCRAQSGHFRSLRIPFRPSKKHRHPNMAPRIPARAMASFPFSSGAAASSSTLPPPKPTSSDRLARPSHTPSPRTRPLPAWAADLPIGSRQPSVRSQAYRGGIKLI